MPRSGKDPLGKAPEPPPAAAPPSMDLRATARRLFNGKSSKELTVLKGETVLIHTIDFPMNRPEGVCMATLTSGDRAGTTGHVDLEYLILDQRPMPSNVHAIPDATLRFLAVGDFGEQGAPATFAAEGMALYAKEHGNPHFILGLGDNIYPSGVDSIFDESFHTCWADIYLKHPALRVPWQLILGNHDYESGCPEAQVDYTRYQLNPDGIWRLPAKNYSFKCLLNDDLGTEVNFHGLDTNGCQGYIRRMYPEKQEELHESIKDLREKLLRSRGGGGGGEGGGAAAATVPNPAAPASVATATTQHPQHRQPNQPPQQQQQQQHEEEKKAGQHDRPAHCIPWNIVFAHHPLHTKGRHHSKIATCLREVVYDYNGAATKGLSKTLNELNVQGYFSGHEHVSQHHKSGDVDSFVCGGVSKQGFYGGEIDAPMDWVDRSFQLDANHKPAFAAVTLNAHEMVTTFVQADYSFEVGRVVCRVIKTVTTPRELL